MGAFVAFVVAVSPFAGEFTPVALLSLMARDASFI
jgi:hypothetical protein